MIILKSFPVTIEIHTSSDLWLALKHTFPSIFAFILSFIVILITWVNHHNTIKLVNRSSSSFMYANGLLLFSVAFIPFPTSLIGEFISTDHAAPAVILYNAVLSLQAVGWILICRAAVKHQLGKNEKAREKIRENGKFGYFACLLYALSAILAIWFPVAIAISTTITWVFWLIYGVTIKDEEKA